MSQQRRFDKALEYVGAHKGAAPLTQTVQLELYGLFKQATIGPAVESARPSAWDLVGRAKFDAWFQHGDMSVSDARAAYCAVLDRVFPGWDAGLATTAAKKRHEVGVALFEDDGAHVARTTTHEFWDKQPLPNKWGADDEGDATQRPPPPPEMIDNQIAVNVSHEPLALPPPLEWCDDEWAGAELASVCAQVYQLSRECAPEGAMMFAPSAAFLAWSMNPPAMKREWLVGFRQKDTRKLVGFICGLPCSVSIHGVLVERLMEIKNMYVHPELRGSRLAPVLIGEVSRRVRHSNYCVALYTSSVTITRPITRARYYQRALNCAKLVAAHYKNIARGQTLARLQRRFGVPSDARVALPRWRRLDSANAADCAAAHALLNAHQARFALHQRMSAADFQHWFVRCPANMHAYVCGGSGGVDEADPMTGFCSWFVLDAVVADAGCSAPLTVHGAFVHYAAVRDAGDSPDLSDVLEAAIVQAARDGVDVCLLLDIGGNEEFLLDFTRSRAEVTAEPLLYHLYNFKSLPCDADQMNVHFL